jgi:uncharacterized repeat protein (TIGR02543 family)
MKMICSFLIALALIAGMAGCGGGVIEYNLTMAAAPGGSGTATDLTNTSPYAAGTAVSIQAVAKPGYQFVGWTASAGGFANANAAETTFTMPAQAVTVTANFAPCMVTAGDYHTVGLKTNGTLVAAGDNSYGQCNVLGWTNITQVAAGPEHTVGLKSDGTVAAVGNNTFGRCNVVGWTGIVQVAAGGYHTVGLRANGTVVGAGRDGQGQQDFESWTDIVQVAAGEVYTVGLKSNGTVVITGSCACDVSGWDLIP